MSRTCTLVVVDMQEKFVASCSIVPAVACLLRIALQLGWFVVVLEFGNQPTWERLTEIVKGYGQCKQGVKKSHVDGSREALEALKEMWDIEHGMQSEEAWKEFLVGHHFVVCGVNTHACVLMTVEGLINRAKGCVVDVPQAACNTFVSSFDWNEQFLPHRAGITIVAPEGPPARLALMERAVQEIQDVACRYIWQQVYNSDVSHCETEAVELVRCRPSFTRRFAPGATDSWLVCVKRAELLDGRSVEIRKWVLVARSVLVAARSEEEYVVISERHRTVNSAECARTLERLAEIADSINSDEGSLYRRLLVSRDSAPTFDTIEAIERELQSLAHGELKKDPWVHFLLGQIALAVGDDPLADKLFLTVAFRCAAKIRRSDIAGDLRDQYQHLYDVAVQQRKSIVHLSAAELSWYEG